jgi:hypothetical protein
LRAFCFHEPAVFVRGFCQVPPLLLVWGIDTRVVHCRWIEYWRRRDMSCRNGAGAKTARLGT